MYKKQMVPEPPSCVHTAGLPAHPGPAMATLLRELSAFPGGEEQRSWLAARSHGRPRLQSPGCVCWGCALVCQRWDNAGSRPEPGRHEERLRPMPVLGWAQRLCSLLVFPDGSGCAMLNGKQIPILPSVLLCSH